MQQFFSKKPHTDFYVALLLQNQATVPAQGRIEIVLSIIFTDSYTQSSLSKQPSAQFQYISRLFIICDRCRLSGRCKLSTDFKIYAQQPFQEHPSCSSKKFKRYCNPGRPFTLSPNTRTPGTITAIFSPQRIIQSKRCSAMTRNR